MLPCMAAAFDTAAIVRDLEAADMDRRQAEAVAAACHKAATAAQPVTPEQLEAALAKLEVRLVRWMVSAGIAALAVQAALVIAAVKLIP